MPIQSMGSKMVPSLKELNNIAEKAKFITGKEAITSDIVKANKELLARSEASKKADIASLYTSPFHTTGVNPKELAALKSNNAQELYFNNAMKTRSDWEKGI